MMADHRTSPIAGAAFERSQQRTSLRGEHATSARLDPQPVPDLHGTRSPQALASGTPVQRTPTRPAAPPGRRRPGTARAITRYAAGTIDWELLHWLLRCPFSRMQDLATFCGVSVSTMCRRLETTGAQGLVEQVRVAGLTRQGMERVYHLSNQGLHVLAAALGSEAAMLGRTWRSDELRLLQQLPRVAHLVRVQMIMGGLLTGAQLALGERGRRVRGAWHWVRTYAHPFPSRLRARRELLQVDAALALHVTAQSTGRSAVVAGGVGGRENTTQTGVGPRNAQSDIEGWERQDRWYAAFVLADARVQDWRAARRALNTLLSYRECSERWNVYQFFPPLLILAHSARHAERWRALAREVSESRQLPDLVGAVAVVPGPPDADPSLNPWRLAWRRLTTGQTIALRSLVLPMPRGAVPPGLDERGAPVLGVDPERTIALPRPAQRVIVGHFDQRVEVLARRSMRRPLEVSSPSSSPGSQAPMAIVPARRATARPAVSSADAPGSCPSQDKTENPTMSAVQGAREGQGVGMTGAGGPGDREVATALDGGQRTDLRLLTARMGGRLVEVLDLLFRAPWIEVTDIAALLGMPLSSADRYLSTLARHALLLQEGGASTTSHGVARSEARAGQRTHLCFAPRCRLRLSSRGQHLVAAMHGIGLRSRLAQRAAPREPAAVQRSYVSAAIAHGRHDHAVGTYHFFALLARAAAEETARSARWHESHRDKGGAVPSSHVPLARLVWWETSPLCEDRYPHQGHWHNLRPDGAGVYQAGTRRLKFWLEWDCGSMNGVDLTRKFGAYATYITSGRWREVTPDRVLPVLLIVVQGRGQMDRMRRVATQVFASLPALAALPTFSMVRNGASSSVEAARMPVSPLPAFITLAHRLEEAGPLAAIWWPLLPPASAPARPTTLESGREPQVSPIAASAPSEGPRCVFPRLLDDVSAAPVDARGVVSDQEPQRSGRTVWTGRS